MANVKIDDLVAITDPASTDVLPIVDLLADVTKKVSIENILKNAANGTAVAPSLTFDTDQTTGIFLESVSELGFSTNGVGRLYIDENGNVGIGTATPTQTLDVVGTGSFSSGPLTVGGFNVVTVGDTGTVTSTMILDGTIVDADINANAEIAVSKLANGTARQLLQTDAAGTGVEFTSNVDVPGTLDVTGVAVFDSNVGIGTTNPAQLLELSSSAPRIRITDSDTTAASGSNSYLEFYGSDARAGIIYTDAIGLNIWADSTGGNNLAFRTGTNEKMRIDSNGNVGIGTSSPSQTLEVNGSIYANNATARIFAHPSDSAAAPGFTWGGQTTGMFLPVNGNLAFSTVGTERLRIDSSGNVGIGTSNPTGKLEIAGNSSSQVIQYGDGTTTGYFISRTDVNRSSADVAIRIHDFKWSGTSVARIKALTGDDIINKDNGYLTFETNNGAGINERMRIASNGDVGIGTNTPDVKLHVEDIAAADDTPEIKVSSFRPTIRLEDKSSSANSAEICGDDALIFRCSVPVDNDTALTEHMRIRADGNVGIGTSIPDGKLHSVGGTTNGINVAGVFTGGTAGGTGAIDTDEVQLRLSTNNSNSDIRGAWISALNTTGASQGHDLLFYTNPASANPVERMRIDSNGHVGIGTASPSTALDITDTDINPIQIKGSSSQTSANLRLGVGSTGNSVSVFADNTVLEGRDGGLALGTSSNDPILFYTNSGRTERMRIDSSGDIGIGTSSPSAKLDVTGGNIVVQNTTGNSITLKTSVGNGNDSTFLFQKSRGGAGTIADVENGDDIGTISWGGYYSGAFQNNSTIRGEALISGSYSDRLLYDSDQHLIRTGNITRVTVDNNGNVAIGNHTPSYVLDVQDSGAEAVLQLNRTDAATAGVLLVGSGNTANFITSGGTKDLFIATDNTERMRIDSNGDVGIGTSNPTEKLTVDGNINFTTNTKSIKFIAGNSATNSIECNSGSGPRASIDFLGVGTSQITDIVFKTPETSSTSAERMRIKTTSGNVGIGTSDPSSKIQVDSGLFDAGTTSADKTLLLSSGLGPAASGALGASIAFNRIASSAGNEPRSAIAIKEYTSNFEQCGLTFWTHPTSTGTDDMQEAMCITHVGNVGIGTSNPSSQLQVQAATSDAIRLDRGITNGTSYLHINADRTTSNAFIGGINFEWDNTTVAGIKGKTGSDLTNKDDGEIVFETASAGTVTERMRIDSSGNVGIGTSSPTQELDIAADSPRIRLTDTDTTLSDEETSSGIEFYQSDDSGAAVGASILAKGDGSTGRLQLCFNADNNVERMRIQANGNVGIGTTTPGAKLDVNGSLSKNSGSFKIDHPLPALTETHHLVHSFVEAPDASNLYAGMVDLVDGTATVNIDTAHRMTEGTFEALNTLQSWASSNESGYAPVKCSMSGNILTIECQDPTSTDTVYYEVRGIRKDQHMLDTEWTDSSGRVITEPLKPVSPPV